jgi:hypothetical protein
VNKRNNERRGISRLDFPALATVGGARLQNVFLPLGNILDCVDDTPLTRH